VEELKARVDRLREQKKANAELLVFLDSPVGKRWLAGKQVALAMVLADYAKIGVEDAAELVVRKLIANITRERFLRADLEPLEKATFSEKNLDSLLAACHRALEMKEKSARIGR
jgi:hypothetical protein